jgi:hypothetical protein
LTSEGKDDTAPKHIELAMTIIYPPVLGLFESPMQICLKSLSCMRLVSSQGNSQMGEPFFWTFALCLCAATYMASLLSTASSQPSRPVLGGLGVF